MAKQYLYINLPSFVAHWLINDCGGLPVKFKKGTPEYMLLEVFMQPGAEEKIIHEEVSEELDEAVQVMIPSFKYKNESFNTLPPRAKTALEHMISERFSTNLFKDLHRFGNIGKKQKDLIYAWMEAHGIPDEGANWEAIDKRYQRLRKTYLATKRKQKQRSNLR